MQRSGLALMIVVAIAALVGPRAAKNSQAAEPGALRAMTFNIRYDNPRDGENVWPNRKEKVASVVQLYQADIVGMQEALRQQIDQLAKLLPAYDWIGVGRQDGKDAGEFTPIFYRRDRLKLVEQNTFWLSETPDKPGSRSWDAALPRIVTWAKLRLANAEEGSPRDFYVFNTHFDHIGLVARLESAKLIRAKVAEIAKEAPCLVLGDLNCTADSPPYRWLIGSPLPAAGTAPSESSAASKSSPADAGLPPALTDAGAVARRPHHGPTTTWNGFTALAPGRKIDHILVHGPLQIERQAILADHWDGKFPSDHLPVMVEFSLK